MANIFEFNLRRALQKEITLGGLKLDDAELEKVMVISWGIVGKLQNVERMLRLKTYHKAKTEERELIRGIIDANDNIGEPYYVILKQIRKYLSNYPRPQKDEQA